MFDCNSTSNLGGYILAPDEAEVVVLLLLLLFLNLFI